MTALPSILRGLRRTQRRNITTTAIGTISSIAKTLIVSFLDGSEKVRHYRLPSLSETLKAKINSNGCEDDANDAVYIVKHVSGAKIPIPISAEHEESDL